jgi:hypothetical protein
MSQGRLSMVVGNGQIRLGWQNLIAQAKGFTLIEVIIIIVLVAIFMSTIGLPFLAGIRESELPEIVATAHFLAAEKLEELSGTDYYSIEPDPKAALSGFAGFEREAVVSDVDCSDLTAAGSSTGCIKIEVKIYHPELPAAGISLVSVRTPDPWLSTDSYVGTGGKDGTPQSITGVGFQPDVVLVKCDPADKSKETWCATSSMGGATSLGKGEVIKEGVENDRISSLDVDGFTVGTKDEVNKLDTDCYYMAFKERAGLLDVGTYTGDGTDDRSITGIGFKPDYVILMNDQKGSEAVHRSSAQSGDATLWFEPLAASENLIQTLEADGFQVGSGAEANELDAAYHYIAWQAVSGQVAVGSYAGDGNDDRAITGAGFQPDYVIVKTDDAREPVHRPASLAGDRTFFFSKDPSLADAIQAQQADGFQVGTAPEVNRTPTYYWMAFDESTWMATGSYVGDGKDGRSVTGAGFQPDAVIVKCDLAEETWCATSSMSGGSTALGKKGKIVDGKDARIISLDGDGFTVSNEDEVNKKGKDCYYVAFQEVAGELDVGTYTGDGKKDRSITGTGFQPDYVIVMGSDDKSAPVHRSSAQSGDSTLWFEPLTPSDKLIQALESDGFAVEKEDEVNKDGKDYHYIAWKASSGKMAVGSYDGDGTDDRDIAGLGFGPEYVIIKSEDAFEPVHRSASLAGDSSLWFADAVAEANLIQALDTDGFQVGDADEVNRLRYYYWMAFDSAPPMNSWQESYE